MTLLLAVGAGTDVSSEALAVGLTLAWGRPPPTWRPTPCWAGSGPDGGLSVQTPTFSRGESRSRILISGFSLLAHTRPRPVRIRVPPRPATTALTPRANWRVEAVMAPTPS